MPIARPRRPDLIVLVLGLHAGVATGDVARPRAYPPASTILVEPAASPYRAHVARMGEVTFAPGGEPSRDGGHELPLELELPVAGERGDQVRIVVEHDDARSLVWVAADDLAWSIARPVRLAGRGDAGVWLSTGAPVTIEASAGTRRAIGYRDEELELRGTVGAGDVARVFPVSRELRSRADAVARGLRVAPGGALLHAGPLPVEALARRRGWVQVEYRSRYVRIRGWARAGDVEEGGLGVSSVGAGSGYGMSDTERVEVTAGACLFDREGGAPVALQLARSTRYVADRRGDWWLLYVGTPWGLLTAWGHAPVDGAVDLDGEPAWERCDRAPP